MKKKAAVLEFKDIKTLNISKDLYRERNIFRIINQELFDYPLEKKQEGVSLLGGCQTSAIFSAIESFLFYRGTPYTFSDAQMREMLIKMDKFFNGKVEKTARPIEYFAQVGMNIPGIGKIFATDLFDIAPKDATFDDVKESILCFDFVGVTVRIAADFFSDISGTYGMKSYSAKKKKPTVGFHSMRMAIVEKYAGTERIIVPNSWGTDWPTSPKALPGTGFILKKNFNPLGFSEIKCCNFVIRSF